MVRVVSIYTPRAVGMLAYSFSTLNSLLCTICGRKVAKMALFERSVSIEASQNTQGVALGSLNRIRLALSIIPDGG